MILSKEKRKKEQQSSVFIIIKQKRKQKKQYLLFVAPVETPKDPVALPAFALKRSSLIRVTLPP